MNRPIGPNARLAAVLGPTNTGKTHYAVERMLGHASGMMGFPLRLLAREIYDRIVALRGAGRVALLTGEEKIVPRNPAWWVCTVEAMPLGRPVDFLAVDEIQLAADPQRGHVFTRRLLHARGRHETLFLGSDTMAPLVRKLLPGVEILSRPRLSSLRHALPRKLERLAKRSAIVAFSVEDVYATAEFLRRRRGGAAVVTGGLSPRTRNAQVAMFQAGEVDFLVATDAIGMGLNMDIDHVAFAGLHKFDGLGVRRLEAAEIAQIAGRAGRHLEDGSFSTLAGEDMERLDAATIARIEDHRFVPLRSLNWRNGALDYRSPAALLASLAGESTCPQLRRAKDADDLRALRALTADPGIMRRADTPERLRLLWEICSIPDFRNLSPGDHHHFLGRIYIDISGPRGVVDDDFVAREVRRLDKPQGDIDSLSARLAGIRIWTYIAHQGDWLHDSAHWSGVARDVEDRLGDALHAGLMQRFVDRRMSVMLRRMRHKGRLAVSMEENDDIVVEGRVIGRLAGFAFRPDEDVADGGSASDRGGDRREELRALERAAGGLLADEISRRVKVFRAVGQRALVLDLAGGPSRPRLLWQGEPIAEIVRGDALYRPAIRMVPGSLLGEEEAQGVQAACAAWLAEQLEDKLAPLLRLGEELAKPASAEGEEAPLVGLARGVAFRLHEQLGILARKAVAAELREIEQDARKGLRRFGIRIGTTALYIPLLLKPRAAELRLMLWALWHQAGNLPELPTPGLVWITTDPKAPREFYELAGFRLIGGHEAIRLDMLERLADAVRPFGLHGAKFPVTPEIMGLVGCSGASFARAMRAIGYGAQSETVVPDPAPAPSPEPEPEPVTGAEASPGVSQDPEVPVAPEPPEPVERTLFFWAPPRPRAKKPAPARAKPEAAARKPGGRDRKPGPPPAARRPERPTTSPPVNESSPFASLGALRDALARKG